MRTKKTKQIVLFSICRRCFQPGDFYEGRQTCKKCVAEVGDRWVKANKEKRNARAKARYHGLSEDQKAMKKLDMRARRYGITVEQLQEMEKKQGGQCAICGATKSEHGRSEVLYLDHCHKTQKPRALLCHHCNMMIGNAKDSIEILERAIAFLKEHQE